MRFITARELRAGAGSLWKQLRDGDDVVVTLNGKPVALLLPADKRFLETRTGDPAAGSSGIGFGRFAPNVLGGGERSVDR
ncbi:type II toxin-antitoxin system Phd/YefM family antitoxin [Kyrpidia tusciae]|uniref:Antitoxin n=1 Tax=Kyrpidia tusciae (strain DSM 2912 / NBRC 15312 / T2) TaxID=562970 RepID=D5WX08_KYRT2|nr:prevent-host-death family protein [Kyrpidia tusciae DSM 2912]